MLSGAETHVLAAFKSALEARFGDRLVAVVLFGSRARGQGTQDSDLDVLVQVRALTPVERRAVIDLAFDTELATGLVISPLVRDPGARALGASLASEIARDGVAL